jgi:ketosteroid isomerase-like protein
VARAALVLAVLVVVALAATDGSGRDEAPSDGSEPVRTTTVRPPAVEVAPPTTSATPPPPSAPATNARSNRRSTRHRAMPSPLRTILAGSGLAVVAACTRPSTPPAPSAADANAGIDSLNARIARAYRAHDPQAYAALYTDSAVFEWPAFATVRGSAALAEMARGNWASLRDMDLRLTVASRRIATDHATEFGAFEQSWRDSAGVRRAEFGRYVALLVRRPDGAWLMDRFFGFADSTRPPER